MLVFGVLFSMIKSLIDILAEDISTFSTYQLCVCVSVDVRVLPFFKFKCSLERNW